VLICSCLSKVELAPFRTIQVWPNDQRTCADRLLMRQTACARRFLPAMIRRRHPWEGAYARHETTGVRHAARRRGGGMAARGKGAAAGNARWSGFCAARRLPTQSTS
jgi:hypothetical protein